VEIDPAIRAVAVLDDELRRGMYRFIRSAARPVTRDEAAAAVGISRKLAAFHLDKLVDAGVLRAGFQPVTGIRRAGRAPKVYEPVDTDIRISIPPRQYDLLAEILLAAVLADGVRTSRSDGSAEQHGRGPSGNGPEQGDGDTAREAALRVAGERGRSIGAAERERTRPGRLGTERALTLAMTMLNRHGFELIRESPASVRLRSCPFHPLALAARELVCGINHRFLAGMIDGLDAASSVCAVLDPRAGECCVELRAST
jgi:predicted ArsR family transcriptional regulator